MMKGDVKGAFRYIPVAATIAHFFAGSFSQSTVVDLVLPFGWTGSPAHYGIFGGAMSFLVAREITSTMDRTRENDVEPVFS